MDGDGDMDIYRLLVVMTPLLGYENDGTADPSWAAANIATECQMVHDLYLLQIWTVMGIWISYRLLLVITPLLGMRMTDCRSYLDYC